MSNLMKFKHEKFGMLRTITKDGEPWFIAKDIAEILGYAESSTLYRRLDDDEKMTANLAGISKTNPTAVLINESGLYNAILGSQKPEAKKFKKWVTSEVLPSIRKTGGFVQKNREEEFIENYFPSFSEEVKLAMVQDILRAKKQLEDKVERDAPLVSFAETCLKSKDNILVRQLAKIAQDEHINIGEKRLYQKMRDWNFILKIGTEPSQMAMNQGYFLVEERVIDTAYGTRLIRTTKVTPKGQVAIIQRLKKEKQYADGN